MADALKWIWFDLDDTLYDFSASSLIALRGVYDKYGLGNYFSDVQQWIDIYHRHNSMLWSLYNRGEINQPKLRYDRFYLPLKEVGVDDAESNRLNPLLDEDYLSMLGATGLLVDGAMPTLQHLKSAGYAIGVLSNGFRGVQHEKLRSSRLDKVVDAMVLSDDVGVNKPDRRIFDHALAVSGVGASESLMVGDNPDTDIAGAVNAGWRAVLFNPAMNEDEITVNGTGVPVVNDLRKLTKFVTV